MAVSRLDGSANTISVCRAVEATDQSAATIGYERRAVRGWLADADLLAKQPSEAIAAYEAALAIDTKSDADEVNAGELLTKMAIAYATLGDLEAADRSAASAVTRVKAALAAHPDQPDPHLNALRTIYSFSARVKRLRGDAEAAATLERKAAAPGPPSSSSETTCRAVSEAVQEAALGCGRSPRSPESAADGCNPSGPPVASTTHHPDESTEVPSDYTRCNRRGWLASRSSLGDHASEGWRP